MEALQTCTHQVFTQFTNSRAFDRIFVLWKERRLQLHQTWAIARVHLSL